MLRTILRLISNHYLPSTQGPTLTPSTLQRRAIYTVLGIAVNLSSVLAHSDFETAGSTGHTPASFTPFRNSAAYVHKRLIRT
jgi:hypothetical protein